MASICTCTQNKQALFYIVGPSKGPLNGIFLGVAAGGTMSLPQSPQLKANLRTEASWHII